MFRIFAQIASRMPNFVTSESHGCILIMILMSNIFPLLKEDFDFEPFSVSFFN